MNDGFAPSHPFRHAGPRNSAACEQDEPLALFVGREFAVALTEGLRRAHVTPRTGTGPPPKRPSAPPRTPGSALLAACSPAILARFDQSLASAPDLAGPARAGLAAWARQVLGTVTRSGPTGRTPPRRAPAPARRPGPTTGRLLLAVPLLIEAAVLTLPSGDPATREPLHTLARAVRVAGTGTGTGTGAGTGTGTGVDTGIPEGGGLPA
jgi:hypothetical protein